MGTELLALNSIETTRAQEITALHNEIGGYLKMSLEKAIRIGELLAEQKAGMEHGGFMFWVRDNLPFTDRTARNYMALYRERDRLKTETVSVLTEGYRLLIGSGEEDFKKSCGHARYWLGVILENLRKGDSYETAHFKQASHYSNLAMEDMERQLGELGHGVEAIKQAKELVDLSYELAFNWAEIKLYQERNAGQALNWLQSSAPWLYDFLMANEKKGLLVEALNWVIDGLKKRIKELEGEG